LDQARHSPQGIEREQGATVMRLFGLIAADRGDLEQALKYFDGAISLARSHTFIWIDRARTLVAIRAKLQKTGDASGVQNCDLALKQAFDFVTPTDPVYAELQTMSQAGN
jgi:hypothetical protein